MAFLVLNAGSYFVRSAGGDLLDRSQDDVEAIGFPFLVWSAGGFSGVLYFSLSGLLGNAIVAISTALVLASSPDFLSLVDTCLPTIPKMRLHFSLREMLGVGLAITFILVIGRHEKLFPILLAVVVLGFPALCWTAWRIAPHRIDISPCASIAFAIFVALVFLSCFHPIYGCMEAGIRIFSSWTIQFAVIMLIERMANLCRLHKNEEK